MKNSFRMLLFAISLAFLTGCGNDSPELTAQKWQKAILSGDLKGANEISTEESHKLTYMIITNVSDKNAEITKAFAEAKFDIVKYEGNIAVVSSSNVEDDEEIELVKLDGKWLVNLSEMMKKTEKKFEDELRRAKEERKKSKKTFEQIRNKNGSNGENDK